MVTIHPIAGAEARIVEILDSMRGLIAINVDCQGCFLAVEAGGSGAICYMERWNTREALERHVRSSLYCRVLEAMELSRIPPKVEFFDVNAVGGLEWVEKARVTLLQEQ